MEPIKNFYNKNTITQIALAIRRVESQFDSSSFITESLQQIQTKELKDRVIHIAEQLRQHLHYSYDESVSILLNTLAPEQNCLPAGWNQKIGISGFLVWPYTVFVSRYGLSHISISLQALYEMTKRFTAEFDLRPFIEHYPNDVYKKLTEWKKDSNPHVRRLVSEATRPRLPWAKNIKPIDSNLSRNIRLIYSLRMDDSPYVRKSVANHLNDISRIDPELFIKTIQRMKNSKKEQWVKRHAARTLLKQGHPRILNLLGYTTELALKVQFSINQKEITLGSHLELKVDITQKEDHLLYMNYIVFYLNKNGDYSRKVYRLRDSNEKRIKITKSVNFSNKSTRKIYPGKHYVQLQINGKTYQKILFTIRS